jgi:hypothetical protein
VLTRSSHPPLPLHPITWLVLLVYGIGLSDLVAAALVGQLLAVLQAQLPTQGLPRRAETP